jgi:hypothetical protein
MYSSLSKNLVDHFASLSPKLAKRYEMLLRSRCVPPRTSNLAPFGDKFSEEETEEESESVTG